MVKGMSIASFTYDIFHSIDTCLFSSLNESHELKNLTKKTEKVLTFFSLSVFNLIHLFIISKL